MARHERPTLPGGELAPEIGSFRHVPAQLPAVPNPIPSRDEFVAALNKFGEVMNAVRETLAGSVRELSRICGPSLRHITWLARLHDHRRHQDERRCVAKAGRRERTGWRQSA